MVPGEAFFEQRFFISAATVEIAWGRVTGRELAALTARVVPGTKGVTSAVQGAEQLDASVRTQLPALFESVRRVESGGGQR